MGKPVYLALGGLLAMAAAMGTGRFVYTPILPYMVSGVGLNPSNAGLIASANYLGYLLGALLASLNMLRGAVRTWFVVALALSAITTAAMGLTSATTAFLVLRFVGGIASAFVLVFASTLILDRLAAAKRSGLSALHFGGVGIGIAGSAVLVAFVSSITSEWQVLWFASGALTLVCLLLAMTLIRPDPAAPRTETRYDEGLPASGLVALVLGYGLFGFGYVITATFISVMVVESAALAPAEPYVWLVFGLAAAPSVYFWTRAAAHFGGVAIFSTACLIEAVGVVVSVIADSPALALFAAFLVGGTFMGITALGLVEARKRSPNNARRIIAIMTASFGLGQMVAPWMAGLLRDATGSFAMPSYIAAGALVAAALIVGLGTPRAGETQI